jgi:hypothetical protein
MEHRVTTADLSDLALGKCTPEEAGRLLDEVERDPDASATLEAVVRLVAVAETPEGIGVFCGRRTAPESWWSRRVFRLVREPVAGYAVAAAAALLVVGVCWGMMRHPYAHLVRVDATDFGIRVRGEETDALLEAQRLAGEGQLEAAVAGLERALRRGGDSAALAYMHYGAGRVCLDIAQRRSWAVAPSYDPGWVRRGLVHLRACEVSADAPLLRLEAMWLEVQGDLMLRREEEARVLLAVLAADHSGVGRRAERLLEELDGGNR